MGMTVRDKKCKRYLYDKLRKEGYPTYAKILYEFDVYMTSDPNMVACLSAPEGYIKINSELDADQCSVVVRHEILHWYLNHYQRMINHIAKQRGLDPDALDDVSLNEIIQTIYGDPMRLDNIAKDYEISNRGYTRKDKQAVRNLSVAGRVCRGLITEDDHPDWLDLPFEDMYDMLKKEVQNKVTDGILLDDTTFFDPLTGNVYGVGEMPTGLM